MKEGWKQKEAEKDVEVYLEGDDAEGGVQGLGRKLGRRRRRRCPRRRRPDPGAERLGAERDVAAGEPKT